jgi:hypothetical protein
VETNTLSSDSSRNWIVLFAALMTLAAGPAWAKPDLVVSSVVVSGQVPAGTNIPVRYQIVNSGNEAAFNVAVGVYLGYSRLTDQNSLLIGSTIINSLQPGEAQTLEIVGAMPPGLYDGLPYYIGVHADYPHLISESDDGNNQSYAFTRSVATTVCEADAFEPDSTMVQARALHLGDKRSHNLCDGSADWLYFDASQGQTYIVTTTEGDGASMSLTIRDASGTPLVTSQPYSFMPSLTWVAPASGRYYVTAAPNGNTAGKFTLSLLQASMADLTDTNVQQVLLGASPGGFLKFKDGVVNRGSAKAGPFEIGYYLSADEFVTKEDIFLDMRAIAGVEAGATETNYWSNTDSSLASLPLDLAPGNYWLGAIADHKNQVSEYREHNNVSPGAMIEVRSPLCAPDAFENDDYPARAIATSLGATTAHNFCDDATDWRSFDAIAGQTYVIETSSIGPKVWPVVTLYGLDGKTVLQSVTPSGIPTVWIVWQAPESGRYYTNTTTNSIDIGVGTTYSLTIAPRAALPDLAVRTEGWNTGLDRQVAGGFGSLPVIVRNQGFADANASTAGIYLSTDLDVTTGDLLLKQVEIPALAQGAEMSYNTEAWTYPATLAPGTYYLSAIADNAGRIVEFSEVNNVAPPLEIKILAPPCAPDAYEEDDFPERAKLFQIDVPQQHNGCDDGSDYMYFNVGTTGIYSFSISNVGSNQNLMVSVWDSTGNRIVYDSVYEGAPIQGTLSIGRYLMQAFTRVGENTDYTLNVSLVRKLRGGK